jgi:hypothetical protein
MVQAETQSERAFDQVVEWLEHFESLEDPRQQGKVWYPLDEVLLLCLVAVLAGAESWVEIAEFGKEKRNLLRRFRPFEKGTPSHDQLGDLFAALDAEAFQCCFIAWVGSLTKLGPDIVAVDGKTLRRSYQEGGAKAPIHMISAWSSRQRLVLGQAKVAEKSNEITAIPELLKLLTLKGAIVTIDASKRSLASPRRLPEGDRQDHRREGGGLRAGAEGQPGHAQRRRGAVLHRAEGVQLQGHGDQPAPDAGEEPWPHRNQNLHGDERHRLAHHAASRLGGPQEHRDGRERARDRRWQDRA